MTLFSIFFGFQSLNVKWPTWSHGRVTVNATVVVSIYTRGNKIFLFFALVIQCFKNLAEDGH